MSLSRIIYRLKIINPNVEFAVILSWCLFFPDKLSHVYFLTFALLTSFILLRDIAVMKTIGVSPFSRGLMAVNGLLILSVFCSQYYFRSLLLLAEILLISCYFLLLHNDRRWETARFRMILYIVSAFSLFSVFRYLVPTELFPRDIFFVSTIHEGVIAGFGVLILVYELLKKWNPWFLGLLLVNVAGVYVSESKAAFIGTAAFSILFILLKKKKWIFVALGLVVLTFVIPNPIRSMFYHSITKDPYALNRLNIWNMSLAMAGENWLTGVGLDNFSNASVTYNFKQTKGPAYYFKRPRLTHNDYLKLLTETGASGLIILLGLGYFLIKRFFSSSFTWFNLSAVLLLYLMFQAFIFNILFNPFFFFLFLFLLANILEESGSVRFRSFSSRNKMLTAALIVIVLAAGYVLPWLADGYRKKSLQAKNPVDASKYLEKAKLLTPLDYRIHYTRAVGLVNHFQRTGDVKAFAEAVNSLRTTRRLNRYHLDAYLLEAELYMDLLRKDMKYKGLDEEIIGVLRAAERIDPVSPFIKLKIARVYFEFDNVAAAREEARKALELEPEYAAALYFMQKKIGDFEEDSKFNAKIAAIQEKAKTWSGNPNDYLVRLFEIPPEYRQKQQPETKK